MIPENMKKYLGNQVTTGVFELEKEPIFRFADAVGEKNPLYWQEQSAKQAGYKSIVAPPGMIYSQWYLKRLALTGIQGEPEYEIDTKAHGFSRILDGGIKMQFHKMVCAGDVIKFCSTIYDIDEKQGRLGRMLFITTKVEYTTDTEVPVATMFTTLIYPE